jgi:hypothetical protein
VNIETPYGPFEASGELNERDTLAIMRALEFFELIRTSIDDSFTVDLSGDQPLIVRFINQKRLEIPIFEAIEFDVQRLCGNPPPNPARFLIDGQTHHFGYLGNPRSACLLDIFSSLLLTASNIDSGAPERFRDLFE